MFQPNREELAWAAGFFDGEGCIYIAPIKPRYKALGIDIGQVDRRVLDRFRAAVGDLGKVYGPRDKRTKTRPNGKPSFQYRSSAFEDVQAVIAMLWKFLSPVKRNQAAKTLCEYGEYQTTIGKG